ncbi:MAG: YbaB/EbfC family nucleoid-associated protein [Gordonia sp. (in: high G+C Gram-positive bacteria)]|uniref:YbaB/EbfC family nucleoid-associated protein n=1 Tax=Gordonia sp. (in: high G+C Gram-positive bacteria) TaxID=84139 RepID=UPI003C763A3E
MTAELDAITDRVQRQLGALEDVHRRLQSLQAAGVGDGGRVRVTVNGNGALVDLQIQAGAGGGKAARLSEEIVGAAVRAATDVFTDRAAIMQEFFAEFEALAGAPGMSMEPNSAGVRPNF